ncbi:MAG: hypothetical protein IJA89_08875 [Clostridia bacterium]|nr:hypothetical protein [Clostridia bacterium]
MSYDVVELVVESRRRKMEPASIVQLEGEVQYTRYLPLEMPKYVSPKFDSLVINVKGVERCAKRLQDDFILCGYFLGVIKRKGLYRYCVQEGLQGYTNFYTFSAEVLGISETTAKRMIGINERFCKCGRELPEAYKLYGSSKLAIMSTFENALEEKLTPQATVRDIEKLRKYYVSHEWRVDLDTTWQEDLATYKREEEARRLAKSTYLKKTKFTSAKDMASSNKTTLVTNAYKAYTRFFDETFRTMEELPQEKDGRFSPIMDELKNVMQRLYGEVLKMQSDDIFEDE